MKGVQRITMRSLVDRYLSDHQSILSAKSIISMRSPMIQFARWWDVQHRSPASLAAVDIYEFLYSQDGLRRSTRKGTPGEVSNISYNRKMANVKVFVQWLLDTRVVRDKEVMLHFKRARRKPGVISTKVRLSMAQIMDAVTGCSDPWERWVTAFAFLSMGRQSELLNTRLSHFNLETLRIMWTRPKVGDYDDQLPMLKQLVVEYTRWREEYLRLCPDLDGLSYAIPRRWVRAQGKVVSYEPDNHPDKVGHIIKKAAARALGVTPCSLENQASHIARRSGARALFDLLRDAGVEDPIRVVMTQLGHSVQATTERYIGIRDDRERRDIILAGSDLMNFEEANVIQLHEARG